MTLFVADFEATVQQVSINGANPRVIVTWAGLMSTDTMKCQSFQTRFKGNKFIDALDSFMNTVSRLKDGSTVVFHNLKNYDHAFIFYWVLDRKTLKLFGAPQDFYVTFENGHKIRFFDTLNLLTTTIRDMGIMCGLNKGGKYGIETPLVTHFDKYTTTFLIDDKPVTIPLPLEKAFKQYKWDIYAEMDCEILANGCKMFDIEKLLYNHITTKAGWAWNMLWSADYDNGVVDNWLAEIGSPQYQKHKFKDDKLTAFINDIVVKAYKGGVSYVNPKHRGKRIYKMGRTYDINSMYPWIYSSMHLPKSNLSRVAKGNTIEEFDESVEGAELFIVEISDLSATLKDNVTMPLMKNRADDQLDDNSIGYERHYEGTLTCTSVEYAYLKEHYDIHSTGSIYAMVFERDIELEERFKKHCAYWYERKRLAKTAGEKFIAKLMLNAAYGKVAQYTKMLVQGKYHLDENGVIQKDSYKRMSGSDFANVAAGAFITAYGRVYLAEVINSYGDDFVYCDTDSIHVFGDEVHMDVHHDKLGAFKLESVWNQGCWLMPKTYMEHIRTDKGYEWHCVTAGNNVPVKIDEFKIGNVVMTKRRKYVPGGVLIHEVPFTVGNDKFNLADVNNKVRNLEIVR